jgi:large subunit ribosomal protein L24
MKVKKGDKVKIITGKDRGQTGKVLRVMPAYDQVIVEGRNLSKRHTKARSQGQPGGIIERPMPIHISNVTLAGEEKSTIKAKSADKKSGAQSSAKKESAEAKKDKK